MDSIFRRSFAVAYTRMSSISGVFSFSEGVPANMIGSKPFSASPRPQ